MATQGAMYGYIYETTNLINGKKYIGQHKSNKFDKNYYGSGKLIRYSLNKYGKKNFDVCLIEECSSREQLNQREIYWIENLFKIYPKELIYNIGKGGEGGNTLLHKSEYEIKLIRQKQSNRIPWNKNKKMSEDFKCLVSSKTKEAMNRDEIKSKLTPEKMRRNFSSELRKSIGTRMKGNTIARGRKHIFKDSIEKMVKLDELDFYLSNGWNLGRKEI